MITGHGGNIYELAQRLGCQPSEIIDMSANVNPLGPMPELMTHLQANLSVINALPEVDAGGIIQTFSRFYNVAPDQVMAGNGTTQLIYLIPRAIGARRALIVGPTYSDYRDACAMNRVACEHLICREADDFVPDMAAIEKKAAGADLVFLCNPNNPTGSMVSREAIDALCRALPKTMFVIDESYLPFASQPEKISMITTDLPNVMVLNSMSKAFRIPGLRIGFVKATPALLEKLRAYTLPWSVNSLAQTAVSWLMTHPKPVGAFLAATRTMLGTQKNDIRATLHSQTGIRCFPSAASFILMRLPDNLNAPMVWQHMANHGILIRDCANFTGLDESFIRMSMKKEAQNYRATNLLVQFCRHHDGKGDAPHVH
ncbi:CobD: threonine-phosphate decarboxylase [Desulfosarcina variabilis str. Montpellier]|uniref:threonine-phosphate decarboxylase CobD n=1 Tax=Desulfosarcina variabilis TaxID=2300 RepID=UPI003AFA4C37